jgi:hypothetical protein
MWTTRYAWKDSASSKSMFATNARSHQRSPTTAPGSTLPSGWLHSSIPSVVLCGRVAQEILGHSRRVKSAPSSRATHPELAAFKTAHPRSHLSRLSRSSSYSPFILNFSTTRSVGNDNLKLATAIGPSFAVFRLSINFCPLIRPTLLLNKIQNPPLALSGCEVSSKILHSLNNSFIITVIIIILRSIKVLLFLLPL